MDYEKAIQHEKDHHKRFVKGLETYGLTIEIIKDWKYAGGFANPVLLEQADCSPDTQAVRIEKDEQYRAIWAERMPHHTLPVEWCEAECVCHTGILYNFIIVEDYNSDLEYGVNALIVGSECIKKFLPGVNMGKRICKICLDPHRNTSASADNKCNNHRPDKGKTCAKCKERIPFTEEDTIKRSWKEGRKKLYNCKNCCGADKCYKRCGDKFYYCYDCFARRQTNKRINAKRTIIAENPENYDRDGTLMTWKFPAFFN